MAKSKKQNEEESREENLGATSESDDTFGLPEIEYEPINREEPSSAEPEFSVPAEQQHVEHASSTKRYHQPMEEKSDYKYKSPLKESSSPVPKIVGILLVVLVAVITTWYFLVYQPEQEKAENARIAQEAASRLKREQEEASRVRQRLAEEAEQRRLDSLANISKTGIVEQLSARTGRYYVVVASAIDDDLIMDYATKLSKQGTSSKVIPPFGKYKFYRIAVAEGSTFNEAQDIANNKKTEFSDAVWVLKY